MTEKIVWSGWKSYLVYGVFRVQERFGIAQTLKLWIILRTIPRPQFTFFWGLNSIFLRFEIPIYHSIKFRPNGKQCVLMWSPEFILSFFRRSMISIRPLYQLGYNTHEQLTTASGTPTEISLSNVSGSDEVDWSSDLERWWRFDSSRRVDVLRISLETPN